MWKMIKPLKIRRFTVETTFDNVELCGECRLVGNTLTVTVTKPFVGMSTQVHLPYNKGSLRMEKARDKALDELELCYLDFTTVGRDYDTYKDVVFQQRHYLLEKERDCYEHGKPSKVVWMNSYFDHYNREYVEFCDVIETDFRFFLYYEFKDHSFHRPIDNSELSKYSGLEVVELEELTTYGENINELLPVPFCDKVWSFLMQKENGE